MCVCWVVVCEMKSTSRYEEDGTTMHTLKHGVNG